MMDLTGQMWSWVWSAGMFVVKQVVGRFACTMGGALYLLCKGLVGGIADAVGYVTWHAYVKHDGWSWGGVAFSAVRGFITGVGGAYAMKKFGAPLWGRYGRPLLYRIAMYLRSKLYARGWKYAAGLVYAVYQTMALAMTSESRKY
jgi:hypothetical protein